jgi:hypothetical protein
MSSIIIVLIFLPIFCMSFFELRLLITPMISSNFPLTIAGFFDSYICMHWTLLYDDTILNMCVYQPERISTSPFARYQTTWFNFVNYVKVACFLVFVVVSMCSCIRIWSYLFTSPYCGGSSFRNLCIRWTCLL